MNANELADDLGKALAEVLKLQDQVRQQQAEIEALKNAKDYWCLSYKDVFNKLEALQNENRIWKAMNLSNEEIGLITTDPRFSHVESPLLLDFARAILRKAQEK